MPKFAYKTKIRKIDAYLVAGGLLTRSPWWKFETRRGEKSLVGIMETLLSVQIEHKKGSKVRQSLWDTLLGGEV